jgi:hypothetical protein
MQKIHMTPKIWLQLQVQQLSNAQRVPPEQLKANFLCYAWVYDQTYDVTVFGHVM